MLMSRIRVSNSKSNTGSMRNGFTKEISPLLIR